MKKICLGIFLSVVWGFFLAFVIDSSLRKVLSSHELIVSLEIMLTFIISGPVTILLFIEGEKKAPYSFEKDMHQGLIDNGNIVVGEGK